MDPGLGPQTASGISGERKGGRGGNSKYYVATVRREAESTKCIPGFIGGLYRTFYYNLGDDSFLYIACYTAGPLQPVNVQRGPGLAVGASPRPGKGLRPSASLCAGPRHGLSAPGVAGRNLKKRSNARRYWKAITPPHSDQAWVSPWRSVHGQSQSLRSIPLICGRRLQSTARTALSACVCACVSACVCGKHACVCNRYACVYYTSVCACVRGSEPEALPRCTPAWWGHSGPGPGLSHTLAHSLHTCAHTQGSHGSYLSAAPRRPGRGLTPKGAQVFLTAGARHSRPPAPGWATGEFVASFFPPSFIFFSFLLVLG